MREASLENEELYKEPYGFNLYFVVMSILIGISFIYYLFISNGMGEDFNFWFHMKGVAYEILLAMTFSTFLMLFSIKYSESKKTYGVVSKIFIIISSLILSIIGSFVTSIILYAPFLWFGMGCGIGI